MDHQPRAEGSILYNWRHTCLYLSNGDSNVYLWEKVPELDEPCKDFPDCDEGMMIRERCESRFMILQWFVGGSYLSKILKTIEQTRSLLNNKQASHSLRPPKRGTPGPGQILGPAKTNSRLVFSKT
jgi:hypothetical protein